MLLPDLTILTFWGVPMEVDMHLKLLVTDKAPTLHLKCKFSTAHHLTGILPLVLIKIEQVAWPHNHSRLLLLLQEISDWSRAKTVLMREHLDVTETVEFSVTQVTEILKRNIHQIRDLVHNDPPAKAREITIMMTTTNIAGKTIANPIPSHQLEQRMRTGMQTLTKLNPLQRGHLIHTKQIRVVLPNQMTIPCHMTTTLALLNLNLEVTQAVNHSPAKTPCTLNYEAALSLRKKKISYCKGELKPACPLKLPVQRDIKRCHHLLHPRRANGVMKPTWTGWLLKSRSITKSRLRNERSGIKHLTSSKLWSMLSLPMSLTPMMMCYAGSSGMMTTSGPTPNGQWSCSLYVPVNAENLPGESICPGSGWKQSISWESLIYPTHQHQTT